MDQIHSRTYNRSRRAFHTETKSAIGSITKSGFLIFPTALRVASGMPASQTGAHGNNAIAMPEPVAKFDSHTRYARIAFGLDNIALMNQASCNTS
jgi:hypothetical protein